MLLVDFCSDRHQNLKMHLPLNSLYLMHQLSSPNNKLNFWQLVLCWWFHPVASFSMYVVSRWCAEHCQLGEEFKVFCLGLSSRTFSQLLRYLVGFRAHADYRAHSPLFWRATDTNFPTTLFQISESSAEYNKDVWGRGDAPITFQNSCGVKLCASRVLRVCLYRFRLTVALDWVNMEKLAFGSLMTHHMII